jgi:hypothetical protein
MSQSCGISEASVNVISRQLRIVIENILFRHAFRRPSRIMAISMRVSRMQGLPLHTLGLEEIFFISFRSCASVPA